MVPVHVVAVSPRVVVLSCLLGFAVVLFVFVVQPVHRKVQERQAHRRKIRQLGVPVPPASSNDTSQQHPSTQSQSQPHQHNRKQQSPSLLADYWVALVELVPVPPRTPTPRSLIKWSLARRRPEATVDSTSSTSSTLVKGNSKLSSTSSYSRGRQEVPKSARSAQTAKDATSRSALVSESDSRDTTSRADARNDATRNTNEHTAPSHDATEANSLHSPRATPKSRSPSMTGSTSRKALSSKGRGSSYRKASTIDPPVNDSSGTSSPRAAQASKRSIGTQTSEDGDSDVFRTIARTDSGPVAASSACSSERASPSEPAPSLDVHKVDPVTPARSRGTGESRSTGPGSEAQDSLSNRDTAEGLYSGSVDASPELAAISQAGKASSSSGASAANLSPRSELANGDVSNLISPEQQPHSSSKSNRKQRAAAQRQASRPIVPGLTPIEPSPSTMTSAFEDLEEQSIAVGTMQRVGSARQDANPFRGNADPPSTSASIASSASTSVESANSRNPSSSGRSASLSVSTSASSVSAASGLFSVRGDDLSTVRQQPSHRTLKGALYESERIPLTHFPDLEQTGALFAGPSSDVYQQQQQQPHHSHPEHPFLPTPPDSEPRVRVDEHGYPTLAALPSRPASSHSHRHITSPPLSPIVRPVITLGRTGEFTSTPDPRVRGHSKPSGGRPDSEHHMRSTSATDPHSHHRHQHLQQQQQRVIMPPDQNNGYPQQQAAGVSGGHPTFPHLQPQPSSPYVYHRMSPSPIHSTAATDASFSSLYPSNSASRTTSPQHFFPTSSGAPSASSLPVHTSQAGISSPMTALPSPVPGLSAQQTEQLNLINSMQLVQAQMQWTQQAQAYALAQAHARAHSGSGNTSYQALPSPYLPQLNGQPALPLASSPATTIGVASPVPNAFSPIAGATSPPPLNAMAFGTSQNLSFHDASIAYQQYITAQLASGSSSASLSSLGSASRPARRSRQNSNNTSSAELASSTPASSSYAGLGIIGSPTAGSTSARPKRGRHPSGKGRIATLNGLEMSSSPSNVTPEEDETAGDHPTDSPSVNAPRPRKSTIGSNGTVNQSITKQANGLGTSALAARGAGKRRTSAGPPGSPSPFASLADLNNGDLGDDSEIQQDLEVLSGLESILDEELDSDTLRQKLKSMAVVLERRGKELEIANWKLKCVEVDRLGTEYEHHKALMHFAERAERAEARIKLFDSQSTASQSGEGSPKLERASVALPPANDGQDPFGGNTQSTPMRPKPDPPTLNLAYSVTTPMLTANDFGSPASSSMISPFAMEFPAHPFSGNSSTRGRRGKRASLPSGLTAPTWTTTSRRHSLSPALSAEKSLSNKSSFDKSQHSDTTDTSDAPSSMGDSEAGLPQGQGSTLENDEGRQDGPDDDDEEDDDDLEIVLETSYTRSPGTMAFKAASGSDGEGPASVGLGFSLSDELDGSADSGRSKTSAQDPVRSSSTSSSSYVGSLPSFKLSQPPLSPVEGTLAS